MCDGFVDGGRCKPFMPLDEFTKKLSESEKSLSTKDYEQQLKVREQAKTVGRGLCQPREMLVLDARRDQNLGQFLIETEKIMEPYRNSSNECRAACLSMHIAERLECQNLTMVDDAIWSIFNQQKSVIVPIGELIQRGLGACRHRAILFKYICDHLQPRIPCQLIRGKKQQGESDPSHAWNYILGMKFNIEEDCNQSSCDGDGDGSGPVASQLHMLVDVMQSPGSLYRYDSVEAAKYRFTGSSKLDGSDSLLARSRQISLHDSLDLDIRSFNDHFTLDPSFKVNDACFWAEIEYHCAVGVVSVPCRRWLLMSYWLID